VRPGLGLGQQLAKTDRIVVGTGVTAPILRYNPAIVAQVSATLGYMFPGRVFLGLGRGESLNEVPAGTSWPPNQERFERLEEAIKLIKLLWREDWVTFRGSTIRSRTQIFTLSRCSQSQYSLRRSALSLQGWPAKKPKAL
jgi:alkanesulfonate monooxygenase SsuD/methylene tetrahydromethanopterin reductase-like flavin-dependent oxidoreductase (luciferase family)